MILDRSSDAVGQVLHGLRLTRTSYCRSELTAPWVLDVAEHPLVMFHFVAEGECWLETSSGSHRRMAVGDLVVLPLGTPHRLVSTPAVTAASILRLPQPDPRSARPTYLSHGDGTSDGDNQRTVVLCGAGAFDAADRALAEVLPELLTVSEDGGWVASTLKLMEVEATERRVGGETVIARLFDILVIHAIREWLAASPEAQRGWLGALRDPQLGPGLAMIDAVPERPFTVESLAATAHLSRATFAERFTRMVGMPPMEYVRVRRMQIARGLLLTRDLSPSEVARRVGYGSQAAFSRAYKRSFGISPGATRRAGALAETFAS